MPTGSRRDGNVVTAHRRERDRNATKIINIVKTIGVSCVHTRGRHLDENFEGAVENTIVDKFMQSRQPFFIPLRIIPPLQVAHKN